MAHPSPHDPTAERWNDVDAYLTGTLVAPDEALSASIASLADEGMPEIEVAPLTGKLLHLLARIAGARRVLEVGTLGAYSTIWLARALPAGGRVVTIEAEPHNAEVARRNLARAGVADRVEVREGRGADVLPTLAGDEPFDLVFIDADKESNALYLDWAARLGRPGTVVVVDNVVRSGHVVETDAGAQVDGVRAGLAVLRDDPRFEATALQTLDRKGWDGVAIAILV
ncbi:O-methyltransferase [Microbacterium aquilitoris]|uniref:O-methyltransferase n=1 Tax=Microbacterium aquilitoris TaxID=3067307 RepID=A0ABU3GKR1_9MICO|nr:MULTISPECIES: O-methyltransferase [unclassified Microbacterium]MDT3330945.1 O-methyltransferase [Microbacterium sp. KSW-18]MDT3344293.1 O-methyltransferase [Microbacterium sp. KSW2-22]